MSNNIPIVEKRVKRSAQPDWVNKEVLEAHEPTAKYKINKTSIAN